MSLRSTINTHKVKKLIILVLAVLFVVPTTAQSYSRVNNEHYYREEGKIEHYFGLRLGLNIASISSDDLDLDADAYAGLNFGAIFGIQLIRQAPMWLEIGATYSEKGGLARIDGERVKYRMGNLEMPIVLKYNISLGEFNVQPFFGGFFSWGIMGKVKDYRYRESYSTYDVFNRFDGGIRMGCGAEYQMIYLEAGIDLGAANVSKNGYDTAHTRSIFINLGVNF